MHRMFGSFPGDPLGFGPMGLFEIRYEWLAQGCAAPAVKAGDRDGIWEAVEVCLPSDCMGGHILWRTPWKNVSYCNFCGQMLQ